MSRPVVEIGCFGKLPSYEEFIRVNCHGDEIEFLERWLRDGLHQGFMREKDAWQARYPVAPLYNYYLRIEGGRRFLVGMVAFSHDKGGRQYPFTVFGSGDIKALNINEIFVPILAEDFLRYAAELKPGPDNLDLVKLKHRLEKLRTRIPEIANSYQDAFVNYLRNRRICDFWQSLFGSFEDERKYVFISNLAQTLWPLRQGKVQRFSMALRFPLRDDNGHRTFILSFWLYLTARLARRSFAAPFLLWNTEPESQPDGMLLFLQTPRPESLTYLIFPEVEDEKLCVLARDGEAQPATLVPELRKLMDAEDITMLEWINALETTIANVFADRNPARVSSPV